MGAVTREWVPTGISTKIGSSTVGDWYRMEDVCFNAQSLESLVKTHWRRGNLSLNMSSMSPSDPLTANYTRVKGTLLVLFIHHGFPYNVQNIWHTAQTVYPTSEALRQLGKAPDAVLAWQMNTQVSHLWDFYEKVVKLLGSKGLQTPLFTYDHVGLPGRGICADAAVRLAFQDSVALPALNHATWFSGERPRLAFRRRALDGLGLSKGRRPPDCKAVVVLREPPQGVNNRDELEGKLRAFLSQSGWALTVWRGDRWSADHGGNLTHKVYVSFSDQVSMFHDAALSIMVHGAENVNMVWQPPKAGFVMVVKCNDGGYLTTKFTDHMNFRVFRTHPAGCAEADHMTQLYDVNEKTVYDMDFDGDLLPQLVPAMREMEKKRVCRRRTELAQQPGEDH